VPGSATQPAPDAVPASPPAAAPVPVPTLRRDIDPELDKAGRVDPSAPPHAPAARAPLAERAQPRQGFRPEPARSPRQARHSPVTPLPRDDVTDRTATKEKEPRVTKERSAPEARTSRTHAPAPERRLADRPDSPEKGKVTPKPRVARAAAPEVARRHSDPEVTGALIVSRHKPATSGVTVPLSLRPSGL
jgi:hypothetical protein